jgi:hypothetical protein
MSLRLGKRLHVGIFGPSLCGKSTVAMWLIVTYWRKYRIRSVVCDTNVHQQWPACALVFRDPVRFWDFIAKNRDLAVFVDEAKGTVARDDDLTTRFTQGRHMRHVLHIMGHRATNLLPEQRDQMETLFLFRQSPASAKIFADEWADERFSQATTLAKYQFLQCEKFGDPVTGQHKITPGVFPAFRL